MAKKKKFWMLVRTDPDGQPHVMDEDDYRRFKAKMEERKKKAKT